MKSLQELHQKNHAFCTCELKQTATQPVFGNGNEKAHIMFVGEAPGKDEDLQGIPFVGRAGRILNTTLEQAGIVREDVYITNTVKYRPPNNRDPKPEEKESCREWLLDEIFYIRPQIIATLGRHALASFNPQSEIKHIHGTSLRIVLTNPKTNESFETILFPLYHPAATIYSTEIREVFLKDMKKLANIAKKA